MSGSPPPEDLGSRFRVLMGRWATGVSVVTAHEQGVDAGLTVNALLSVTLRPPAVLVSLQQDTDTLGHIERTRSFGISFLRAEQRDLSERFARAVPSAEKFEGLTVRRGATGVPLLPGALGTLECRLVSTTPLYDHHLLVGEVVHLDLGADGTPLVFFRSAYASAEGADRLHLGPASSGRR